MSTVICVTSCGIQTLVYEWKKSRKWEAASSNFDPLYIRDIRAVEKKEEINEMPKKQNIEEKNDDKETERKEEEEERKRFHSI